MALWLSILLSSNMVFLSLNSKLYPSEHKIFIISFTFPFSASARYSVLVLGYVTNPFSYSFWINSKLSLKVILYFLLKRLWSLLKENNLLGCFLNFLVSLLITIAS